MYITINIHIHICNVTDLYIYTFRSSCYLVLDLKCGGDIRYYLRKKLIFEEKDVAFYVSCIGSALEFIHSMNVLHRYSCMHIWNIHIFISIMLISIFCLYVRFPSKFHGYFTYVLFDIHLYEHYVLLRIV
jgi:hypothetical protein